MAKNVTLASLISTVRFQGDFENSRVMSDAQITAAINSAGSELWDLLLDCRPDQYISTSSTTTTPGSEIVSLPVDFYRLRMVEVQDGSFWRTLRPHNLSEAWRYQIAGSSPSRLTYRIQSNTLRVVPTPTVAWSIRISYFMPFTDLALSGDTFDAVNDYDDLIVARVIAKLRGGREGMDSAWWDAEAARLERDVRNVAGDVDAGEPFALSGQRGDSFDFGGLE